MQETKTLQASRDTIYDRDVTLSQAGVESLHKAFHAYQWKKLYIELCFGMLLFVAVLLGFWTIRSNQRLTSQSVVDNEWQQTVRDLSVAQGPINGVLALSIQPFLKSPEHSQEARAVARLILPNVVQYEAFEDLLTSVYGPRSLANLESIIDLNRTLNLRRSRAYSQRDSLEEASKKRSAKVQVNASTVAELSAQLDELNKRLTLICARMGEAMRTPGLIGDRTLDLSDTFIWNCDMSGADFSHASLRRVLFQDVGLSGAVLRDVKNIDNADFYNEHWWQAKEISAPLLIMLKDQYYPYYNGDIYGDNRPTREEYFTNLERLCKIASVDCSTRPSKFPK